MSLRVSSFKLLPPNRISPLVFVFSPSREFTNIWLSFWSMIGSITKDWKPEFSFGFAYGFPVKIVLDSVNSKLYWIGSHDEPSIEHSAV